MQARRRAKRGDLMGELIDLERERRAREQARQRRAKALREADAGPRSVAPGPDAPAQGEGPETPSTPGQDGGAGTR